MLRLHVCRRLSDRLDGISHGPEGSVDKLLMTWVEQAVGHAALAVGGAAHDDDDDTWLKVYLYSRAQSVMGGTSQIQRNLVATRILGLPHMDDYDLPPELQVEADGPIRIVRLNRPDHLNATNHDLHKASPSSSPSSTPTSALGRRCSPARGRAFSAGGDFNYIDELTRDPSLRATIS